ncbi:MAG TPA: lauroyl acyltransferase [Stellaceae bacterium]|nr:lauroyl acyltransferase [Stellaceae bacterium]
MTIQERIAAAIPGGRLWRIWLERLRWAREQAVRLVEAAGLLLAMAVFASLPVDWASGLGGFIGRTAGPRLGLSRRALRNLRQAMPENSEAENRRILRGMWENLCRAIAEYPHLPRIVAASSGRVEIVNGEALTGLAATSQPGILFGGHLGNWEIGSSTVHRLMGASVMSVYRAANNPWVDRLMRRFHRGRRAVPKGAEGGRELVRQLRDGGSIALLVDQKQNDGIAVPFFGRDAMTAPAIARLGSRFQCPIIPVRFERLAGARFRCTVLSPIELADTGDPARDVLAAMTHVNAMLEDWIRARPEQWLWVHSRWPG